ncbi:integrase catalytic domain-containing protein [Trichonephila clavipes]|nr:integrase catalytic domain-containing protein [Trichonephila clavipes]
MNHIATKQGETYFKPQQLGRECDVYLSARGKVLNDLMSRNPGSGVKTDGRNRLQTVGTWRRERNSSNVFVAETKTNCVLWDSSYLSLYAEFLKEYEELGHLERVVESSEPPTHYYIPHHGVLRPEKLTTKLRIVFNGSSPTTTGISLNDILLKGEVKEDVFETISRFRRHKFAFTTDIQKMYKQILINPDQQELQRIIWKHGLDAEILTYRLKTVTYVLSNAPFLAIRTLQQLAKDEKSIFPLASETLLYDTYMDDINRSPKGFAVASEAAYGAVVYLQCFLHNGAAKVSILARKSRVAPIRVISIPRLELCACVLLAQLVKKIHSTLRLNISDIVLHTDSTIALAWLNTPANRLKSFVANRVAKVQELTEGFQWNHVPSVRNPADLVSRVLRPCDLPNLSDGLLRVGGRLSNSDLPYVNKHRAILPGNHNLTVQIIVHFHRKNLHTGASSLLHYVREKFWPLNGRSLCRKVVHECLVCFKSRSLVTSQLMGNLPRDKVVPDYPFNCSGVEFCGPFMIRYKNQRKGILHKIYICVFVCFVSKAIHIEIVSDLTSDAFIATLKRFFSRRGKCAKLYSDNGKTFVGANKELKRFLKLIEDSDDNLAGFLSAEGIEWKFIPPRAQSFGGLWEAPVNPGPS